LTLKKTSVAKQDAKTFSDAFTLSNWALKLHLKRHKWIASSRQFRVTGTTEQPLSQAWISLCEPYAWAIEWCRKILENMGLFQISCRTGNLDRMVYQLIDKTKCMVAFSLFQLRPAICQRNQ